MTRNREGGNGGGGTSTTWKREGGNGGGGTARTRRRAGGDGGAGTPKTGNREAGNGRAATPIDARDANRPSRQPSLLHRHPLDQPSPGKSSPTASSWSSRPPARSATRTRSSSACGCR